MTPRAHPTTNLPVSFKASAASRSLRAYRGDEGWCRRCRNECASGRTLCEDCATQNKETL